MLDGNCGADIFDLRFRTDHHVRTKQVNSGVRVRLDLHQVAGEDGDRGWHITTIDRCGSLYVEHARTEIICQK